MEQTRAILPTDEKTPDTISPSVRFADAEHDAAKPPRPRISERPLSSLSCSSSTIEERRKSIASLRLSTQRHKKPRGGDRLWAAYRNLPLAVRSLLIIMLTGAPLAVLTGLAFTKYYGKNVGEEHLRVTYENLAVWLDVAWVSFIIVVSAAEIIARFFSWLCHTSSATVKYAPLANTMWFRVTLIAWVGVLYQSTCHIWPISMEPGHNNNWVWTLRRAFEFLTVAFGILLLQGIVLQLIGVQYVQGYVGPRSERALDELETLERLNALLQPYRRRDQAQLLMRFIMKMFRSPKHDIFQQIRAGNGTDVEISGYASILWTSVAGSKSEISQADICERLVELGRNPEGGRELFFLLDQSGDNKVNRHEFEDLVVLAAAQLRKRAGAMKGITLLLRKLEIILCILVFALIMFVYTVFFNPDVAKNIASLWTGVIALSFAFSGPVSELVNSCVWVFAKHTYDVGDLVELMGKRLEVRQIFLTHTNFDEAVTGQTPIDGPVSRKVVQISHGSLTGEMIVNWTRSADALADHVLMAKRSQGAV